MKKILDNKIFKLVYGIFKFVIIALLVLYVLFLAMQRFTGNKSILGYRVFTIATGSMDPLYAIDDVILVKDVSFDDLKIGDDITYRGEVSDFAGKIVTHRIISINKDENKLTTKGIAASVITEDPEISSSQVLGKVSRKLIIFSFLTGLARNKVGFYFLIFVPLVVVVFLEIADVVTAARSDDEDEEDEESDK